MANSVDPDQLASELIWIYTVCKGQVNMGSAGPGSKTLLKPAELHSAVGSSSYCRSTGRRFRSQFSHITSMKFDREIISTVILSLLLIQGGHLSVSGKSMRIKYRLTAKRTKPAQEKVRVG